MKRRRKQEMSIREPESLVLSEFDVLHKYNWYRQNFTDKDAKQFLINYARTESQRKNINSQSYLPFSYCWCARLISNGNTLPEELVRRLDSFIEKLQKEVRPTKKTEIVVRVSTEQRNGKRTYDAYAYLDALCTAVVAAGAGCCWHAAGGILAAGRCCLHRRCNYRQTKHGREVCAANSV